MLMGHCVNLACLNSRCIEQPLPVIQGEHYCVNLTGMLVLSGSSPVKLTVAVFKWATSSTAALTLIQQQLGSGTCH